MLVATANPKNSGLVLLSSHSLKPSILIQSGLYAGSNYCQSHVLVCQSHVLVDMLMLTVKLVYKLSNCG